MSAVSIRLDEHGADGQRRSTSLKLNLVDGDASRPVDTFERADAVGHRVVHGGERFVAPVRIDDAVERAIDDLSEIAPLHNRPALQAIREARRSCPTSRTWRFSTRRSTPRSPGGRDVRHPACLA